MIENNYSKKVLNERIKAQKATIDRLEEHLIKQYGEYKEYKLLTNRRLKEQARMIENIQDQISKIVEILDMNKGLVFSCVDVLKKQGVPAIEFTKYFDDKEYDKGVIQKPSSES